LPTPAEDAPAELDAPQSALESPQLLDATSLSAPPASPEPSGPWIENPVWTGFDLLLLGCVLFISIVLFTAIAFSILRATPQYHGKPISEITANPSVWLVLPAQGAAYIVMFGVLYAMARMRRLQFWPALEWNWPSGFTWMGFLLAGIPLALFAGILQKFLPVPKELPIEKMFLQPGAPQLLAIFGVVVAPFVEETLFRGLLYPVSNRWFRGVLNSQQRIRRGRLLFLLLVPWGFAAQWRPPLGGILLAVTVLLLTGALWAHRALETNPVDAAKVILPGTVFLTWALIASHLSRLSLERASLCLLGLVVVMTLLGTQLQAGSAATRIAIALSFILTAVSFTLLHSDQLAGSWSPLLVLLIVSSVLTFARAKTKSLASGVLIHIGYNSTLFGGAFLASDHFRHLEKLGH
jgi:membrane protease YdiL (CAAX protease family)